MTHMHCRVYMCDLAAALSLDKDAESSVFLGQEGPFITLQLAHQHGLRTVDGAKHAAVGTEMVCQGPAKGCTCINAGRAAYEQYGQDTR